MGVCIGLVLHQGRPWLYHYACLCTLQVVVRVGYSQISYGQVSGRESLIVALPIPSCAESEITDACLLCHVLPGTVGKHHAVLNLHPLFLLVCSP
jgi:hypothetical protein